VARSEQREGRGERDPARHALRSTSGRATQKTSHTTSRQLTTDQEQLTNYACGSVMRNGSSALLSTVGWHALSNAKGVASVIQSATPFGLPQSLSGN